VAHDSWKHFLDLAYWNVELGEDVHSLALTLFCVGDSIATLCESSKSEKTVSIASAITNAYIDFSKMTCSVVALITDVERDGARCRILTQRTLRPRIIDARTFLPGSDDRRSETLVDDTARISIRSASGRRS
jgi:hypothetical protein